MEQWESTNLILHARREGPNGSRNHQDGASYRDCVDIPPAIALEGCCRRALANGNLGGKQNGTCGCIPAPSSLTALPGRSMADVGDAQRPQDRVVEGIELELIFLAFSFGGLVPVWVLGHGRKRVGTSPCHSATLQQA